MSLGTSGLFGAGPPGAGLLGGGPFAGSPPARAARTPRSIIFYVRPTTPGTAATARRPWPARRLAFFVARTAPPADLLEAIVAHLKGLPDVAAAFPGGIWADQAPVGTALPYIVLLDVAESWAYESAGGDGTTQHVDDGSVQLGVFAAGKSAARTLRRQAVAALADAPLLFAGGTLCLVRPEGRVAMKDPDPGPGGVDVWQEAVTFRTLAGRTA